MSIKMGSDQLELEYGVWGATAITNIADPHIRSGDNRFPLLEAALARIESCKHRYVHPCSHFGVTLSPNDDLMYQDLRSTLLHRRFHVLKDTTSFFIWPIV